MPANIDLGDKAAKCLDVILIAVRSGDTVTVTNNSGDTVTYYNNLTSSSAGTIAASANASFSTTPGVWMTSAGRSSLSISGGIYGT
jgi:hypothetical protein